MDSFVQFLLQQLMGWLEAAAVEEAEAVEEVVGKADCVVERQSVAEVVAVVAAVVGVMAASVRVEELEGERRADGGRIEAGKENRGKTMEG